MSNSFINGKPFIVDEEILSVYKELKRPFFCCLCGEDFKLNDSARFMFIPEFGNPFVCIKCDSGDECSHKKLKDNLKLYRQCIRKHFRHVKRFL